MNYEASPARAHEVHDLIESGMTYSNMIAIMKNGETRKYSMFLNHEKGMSNRSAKRCYLENVEVVLKFIKMG